MPTQSLASHDLQDLRYSIGQPQVPETLMPEDRAAAVAVLAELPNDLRNAVRGLDSAQIATPYREGGWTVQQLVHHIADSHMHAVARIRYALTESEPTVAVYNEAAWAELHDAAAAPLEWSLELVESLHARWVMLLQSLPEAAWKRAFVHPERGRVTVEKAALLYAWHSRHHVAHIQRLRTREGW